MCAILSAEGVGIEINDHAQYTDVAALVSKIWRDESGIAVGSACPAVTVNQPMPAYQLSSASLIPRLSALFT